MGLSRDEIVEPLRSLQLLSLEVPSEARQIFAELGGDLRNAEGFSEGATKLGRAGRERALQEAGWQQVLIGSKRFAWDGPLEDLKESHGVPMPGELIAALQAQGLAPRTGIPGDLWNEFAQGYRQVWHIDNRMYKHPVVSRDSQVLLVKPA